MIDDAPLYSRASTMTATPCLKPLEASPPANSMMKAAAGLMANTRYGVYGVDPLPGGGLGSSLRACRLTWHDHQGQQIDRTIYGDAEVAAVRTGRGYPILLPHSSPSLLRPVSGLEDSGSMAPVSTPPEDVRPCPARRLPLRGGKWGNTVRMDLVR